MAGTVIKHTPDTCSCEGAPCKKCGEMKCLSSFGVNRSTTSGVHRYCKSCVAASSRQYHQEHRDQCLAKMRQRYQVHSTTERVAAKERSKHRRISHPQAVRDAQEQSYRKNLSHYRTYQQAYRETHRDDINRTRREKKYHATPTAQATRKAYIIANLEHIKALRRMAVVRRRARLKQAEGTFTLAEWTALCASFAYTCLRCGAKEPDINLTVDHIVPLALGGRNSIDNLQPLCLSCNSSKQDKIADYRPQQKGA